MAFYRKSYALSGAVALGAGLVALLGLPSGCSSSSGYIYGDSRGEGGASNGSPCVTRDDCPSDAECVSYTCTAGVCVADFAFVGQVVANDSPTDCIDILCGEAGGDLSYVINNDEIPASDSNECTDEVCQDSVPTYPWKPDGTTCSGGVCLAGVCEAMICQTPDDCPAAPVCQERACESSLCTSKPLAAGTPVSDASQTDCVKEVCDGAGAVMSEADPDDVPSDGVVCTMDACDGMTPVFTPTVDGTVCGAGMFCYNGACSPCGVDANCAPVDACHEAGTCAAGQCQSGAPLANGVACGGGMFCYSGACSPCGVNANCPAAPTCKVFSQCNGTCVYANQPNGTSCGFLKTCTNGVCD